MKDQKDITNPQGGKVRKIKIVTGTRLDDLRYFENSLTRQVYKYTGRLERPTGWFYGVE